MRGTTVRQGNRWYFVVDMGRDANGKRVRKWHSGFDTKREAQAAGAEILSRLNKGTYVAPSRQTLGAFLVDEWLPAARATVKPNTWSGYRMNVVAYVNPQLGTHRLQDLTGADLNALYADLLTDGRKTARDCRRAVSVMFTALSIRRWRTRSVGTV